MHQLMVGIAFMAMGIILIVVYRRMATKEKESSYFEKPYLKNGGIGMILFGIYYISKYLMEGGA